MDESNGRPDDSAKTPRRIDSSRQPATDLGVHLHDRLNVIHRRRYVAAGSFLLIVLLSLLRTYTTTPLYRAQTRLMIEMEDESTAAMVGAIGSASQGYWQDPKPFYETQYRVLTGTELARRVVRRLGPVRESDWTGPPRPRLNRLLSLFKQEPAQHEAASTPTESRQIAQLLAQVSVAPVQNSQLVDVVVVSADPALAARAASLLADEYVQLNLELRRQNMVASVEWLSRELVSQQKKLEDSERVLAQYREDQQALSLEERQNIVVARLNQLNDAATRAKTNRVQKEALYNQIKALGPDVSADTTATILQNPFVQGIKTRLAELRRERATLLERYGEKYPDVARVDANLQDVSHQLDTELAKATEAVRNDYQSALAEEQTLAAALEEQKDAAMDLNRKGIGYTVLQREAQSNRQLYEALMLREKELQVMANGRGNNVRVTDYAEKPDAPFTPTPARDIVLAIVAGFALSLGLVFLLEYLDDTVKTPDDITQKLKIPFLGIAPKVSVDGPPLISKWVPHEFGEAFRSLRTSLVFSTGAAPTRVVMVTSAQPLEGKTTTVCNLGIALGMSGARVLVIDADMRRPGVHRALGIENGTGLSHVLTGQATMDAALITLDHAKLCVMTGGVPPPNPSELLGSDQMRALLSETKRGRFDWVIVDTPPVIAVTDAVVLSAVVGGIVFVIGSEMTARQHAARALETLTGNGSHLLGAVLNRVDLRRNKYYYSRYYGYKNKNYYSTQPAS
jgi:capsular exopolysaccharide synthesis family protein